MKKILLLVALFFMLFNDLAAQNPNYRVMFRYRISQKKLQELNNNGHFITDDKGNKYTFCSSLKGAFKTLIANKDGVLNLDPWAITDSRTNTATPLTDPCYGTANVINAATTNKLKIDLSRPLIGNPTRQIYLPYQSLIFGITAIGLKVRPSVKDFNGNKYNVNATTGNISLGLTAGYSFGVTSFNHRSSNSYSITPGVSLGFSSASLSKEILQTQVNTALNTNNFIYSPAGSLTLARNDIGFTFSYGKDIMTGKNADAWAYQKKRFFGFGVSAGLKL